jgi:hypothetical protein
MFASSAPSAGAAEAAAKHHAEVMGWLKIAEALGPDGLQSEFLGAAIGPINAAIKATQHFKWSSVAIDAEMAIRLEGRDYALLSESEQWACQAALACAISRVAEIGLVMLDRFDVLDIASRGPALDWLGKFGLDQVLLFGSLKAPYNASGVKSFWLENGVYKAESA